MYAKDLYRKGFYGWKEYTEKRIMKQERILNILLFWKDNMLKRYFWLLKNWKSLVPSKEEKQQRFNEQKE